MPRKGKEMKEERTRGRKRERTPSCDSRDDDDVAIEDIVEEIESHESWRDVIRSPFLFDVGIIEELDWVREIWKTRPNAKAVPGCPCPLPCPCDPCKCSPLAVGSAETSSSQPSSSS